MLVEIGGKVREKVDLGVLQVVLGGNRVVLGGQTHPLQILGATTYVGRIRGQTACKS